MPRISPANKQSKSRRTTPNPDVSPALLLDRTYVADELFVDRKAWFAADVAPELADFWIKNGGVRLDSIHLFEKEVCAQNFQILGVISMNFAVAGKILRFLLLLCVSGETS